MGNSASENHAQDAEAIRRLLCRYCELQDAGDFDAVASLFEIADYGVSGGQSYFGAPQVAAMKRRHVRLYAGSPRTKHVVSNIIMNVDGDRAHAESRSYFTVYQSAPDFRLQVIMVGRYWDQFSRRDDEWCYNSRVIYPDLIGDMSAHILDNPLT